MTVGELKEKLTMYLDDTLIVVDGYEEGFAEDIMVKRIPIIPDKHGDQDGKLYGRHGRVDKFEDKDKETMRVVFIGEGRHLEGGW